MIAQDRLVKDQMDAKNGVEEYVYDMRDKVFDRYQEFVSEEVSARLCFYILFS